MYISLRIFWVAFMKRVILVIGRGFEHPTSQRPSPISRERGFASAPPATCGYRDYKSHGGGCGGRQDDTRRGHVEVKSTKIASQRPSNAGGLGVARPREGPK